MSEIRDTWKKTQIYARWMIALNMISISLNVAAITFTLTTNRQILVFFFVTLGLVSIALLLIGVGQHKLASSHLA